MQLADEAGEQKSLDTFDRIFSVALLPIPLELGFSPLRTFRD
jgi:hypothetical protein